MIARYVAQSEDYMHSPTLEFETIQAAVQFERPPRTPGRADFVEDAFNDHGSSYLWRVGRRAITRSGASTVRTPGARRPGDRSSSLSSHVVSEHAASRQRELERIYSRSEALLDEQCYDENQALLREAIVRFPDVAELCSSVQGGPS